MNKVSINYFKKILLLVLIFFSALLNFSFAQAGPTKETQKPQVMLEELPGLTNADVVARFQASGSDGFIYYLR